MQHQLHNFVERHASTPGYATVVRNVRKIDVLRLASLWAVEVLVYELQILLDSLAGEQQFLIAQKCHQRGRQGLLAIYANKNSSKSAVRMLVPDLFNKVTNMRTQLRQVLARALATDAHLNQSDALPFAVEHPPLRVQRQHSIKRVVAIKHFALHQIQQCIMCASIAAITNINVFIIGCVQGEWPCIQWQGGIDVILQQWRHAGYDINKTQLLLPPYFHPVIYKSSPDVLGEMGWLTSTHACPFVDCL